jgi:putative tricarboxylic transport membrane protein
LAKSLPTWARPEEQREVFTNDVKGLWPTAQDFKDAFPAVLRGTVLGSFLGVLPGGGALLASFAAYTMEKKCRGRVGEVPFGQGNIRGVAGPKAANNAGAQTSFIPMLTLGIPPNAVMALMVGAMTIKGIQPGPAGHDQQPGAVLGPDRQHVGGQRHAHGPEPAAHRHLDQAADRALPLPVPGHHAVLLHRPVHVEQQQLRRLHDGGSLPCIGVRLLQAGLRTGAPLLLGFILGPMMEENLRRALLLSLWRLEHLCARGRCRPGLLAGGAADGCGGDCCRPWAGGAGSPSRQKAEVQLAAAGPDHRRLLRTLRRNIAKASCNTP